MPLPAADQFGRPLKVGDIVNIPATVTSIGVTAELGLPEITVQSLWGDPSGGQLESVTLFCTQVEQRT